MVSDCIRLYKKVPFLLCTVLIDKFRMILSCFKVYTEGDDVEDDCLGLSDVSFPTLACVWVLILNVALMLVFLQGAYGYKIIVWSCQRSHFALLCHANTLKSIGLNKV